MTSYILRRLVQAIIVLLLVTLIVFFAMRLLPGDPIYLLMTSEETKTITEEQIQELKAQYGLDRSLIVQYFDWLGGIFTGDLGTSIRFHYNVGSLIMERVPVTLYLGAIAFIVAHVFGILAGIICAVRRGTWIDTAVTILANIGITVPIFWLGIMMIYLFAVELDWLPVMGYTPPTEDLWLSIRQAIMPVICLAILPMASTARQTRSSMLEVMQLDYIRTAWSKGLREQSIIFRHALKNSLIPVLTLAGLHLGTIIGGSVLVETVFNIAGMGRLAIASVFSRDFLVTQGITVVIAAAVVMVNLVVDIAYGWFDPRIRFR
jgi:peptide/nickel transport system permease protein